MKQLLLSILIGLPVLLKAQLNHFIYFQTEGKQPFYAKLDKKLYSSSASGYLIIPKLKEGTYQISIGFPKSEVTEQQYFCVVDNRDAGYLVKDFGDRGWGLFNLQTLDVVMSGAKAKGQPLAKVEKSDPFSAMLSEAVDDPAIRKTEKLDLPAKPVEQTPVKQVPVENQTATVNPNPVQETKTAEVPELAAKSAIVKKLINYGLDGVELVYIDQTDTVRIFIPAEKEQQAGTIEPVTDTGLKSMPAITEKEPGKQVKQDPEEKPAELHPIPEVTIQPAEASPPPKKEEKFLPIEINKPEVQSEKINVPESLGGAPGQVLQEKAPMINSDCRDLATEDDFLKLRKKMVGAGEDDKMMSTAGKVFKAKCFTTDQIRHLGGLFLTDAGKYRFLDMAYQFVSDSHNYGSLQTLLTDTYYITRFKAMVNR